MEESKAAAEIVTLLLADLQTAIEREAVAICEPCGAPLFEGDDTVSDPEGEFTGCWHSMTDITPLRERPCYAYRVGKPSAALRPT